MRSIGIASRALEIMLLRVTEPKKVMFGKMLYEHGTVVEKIAKSRMEIDQARLLVLSAALQVRRFSFRYLRHYNRLMTFAWAD